MHTHISRWSLGLLMLFVAGLFWMGCDNTAEGEPGDAEQFVGAWKAASVTSSGVGLDLLPLIGGALDITYQSNNNFRLTATNADGDSVADISGTYSVNAETQKVSYTGADLPEAVEMDYGFQDANARLELSFEAEALTALGFDSIGDVVPDISILGTLKATLDRQ